MSFLDDLAGARNIIGRAERIGEEGLTKAEALLTDPEAVDLVEQVFQLVKIGPKPGTIAGITAAVKGIVALFPPQTPAAALQAALPKASLVVLGDLGQLLNRTV